MPDSYPVDVVSQTWTRELGPPAAMPASAEVVIIGGGIVGIATAWFLTKQGLSVVVCEKGHIAGEQSGRNWGWVRQQGRDVREMPMIVESLRIWRELWQETGEDVGFRQHGILYLIDDDAKFERYAAWAEMAKTYGTGSRLIEAGELKSLVHGAPPKWRGALYTESDGRAEPHLATPALARAVSRSGGTVLTGCAVRGIETSAGRVSAVVTEHGRIATSTVLCAAGAWTSMFCRSLGIRVPQLRVRGTVARTAPAAPVFEGAMSDRNLALRRREDGGYTVASGAIIDHPITPSTFRFGPLFVGALREEARSMRLSIGRDYFAELGNAEAVAPRRGLAVRKMPDPGSQAKSEGVAPDPNALGRHVPGTERHADRRELGGHDRDDTRCRAGDRRSAATARSHHRDRVQRSRLRHRTRRGQSDRGHFSPATTSAWTCTSSG